MGRFAPLAEAMGDIERLAWAEVWQVAEDCSEMIRSMPEHRRRRVSQALITEMLDWQQGICPLCDRPIELASLAAFHVDHIIPFTRGGGYEGENLQVTHPACNMEKGDGVFIEDLVAYLERKAAQLGDVES